MTTHRTGGVPLFLTLPLWLLVFAAFVEVAIRFPPLGGLWIYGLVYISHPAWE